MRFTPIVKLVRLFGTAILGGAALSVLLLYLVQDYYIFPNALPNFFGASPTRNPVLPKHYSSFRLRVIDGTELTVWRVSPIEIVPEREHLRALVLHGNGHNLFTARAMQDWLAQQGITNYSYDYRGSGGSSGHPSEAAAFLDVQSVYSEMLTREGVQASDTLLVAYSIGTGIVAGLAKTVAPRSVILFAPYTSISEVIRDRRVLGYFTPLLRYRAETIPGIQSLNSTCIIVAHGEKDWVIPASHSQKIANAWNERGFRWYRRYPNVGHDWIFKASANDVAQALTRCLEQ